MMRNNALLFIFIAVVFIIGILMFRIFPELRDREYRIMNDPSAYQQAQLRVGLAQFFVEIADTPEKQTLGLSGSEALGAGRGMLFVFSRSAMHGFWMKDMKFPIDIIWINNGKVIGFAERAQPDDRSDREVYYPPSPIDMVLEIGAGEVARQGIRVGDVVRLEK